MGLTVVPIGQIGELRLGEVKSLTQCHTAFKSQDSHRETVRFMF